VPAGTAAAMDEKNTDRSRKQRAPQGPRNSAGSADTLEWYLPTGRRPDALVKVTSRTPAEVLKEKEFSYQLIVENISSYMLDDVVVSDVLPSGIVFRKSTPKAVVSNVDRGGCVGKLCSRPSDRYSKVQWKIGSLLPGEHYTIRAEVQARQEGVFAHCTDVAYIPKKCQQFSVIAPGLDVDKAMPAEVPVGETFPVEITVWNDGSGTLRNVTVTDTLPPGLVGVKSNRRTVTFKVEELPPDTPKKYSFQARALQTGVYTNRVDATSLSGLTAGDTAVTKVTRPVVAIRKAGPERVYLGRTAEYRISILNKGDAAVKDLLVTDRIPENTAFVSASHGGVFKDGAVIWNVGTINPGKEQVVSVKVRARQTGRMVNRAEASAASCPTVRTEAATRVDGVSALLLEVGDSRDPVLIGEETTYTITVRNTGTAQGRNIRVKAYLEEQQVFVSSSGASRVSKQGDGAVEFAPVNIAPNGSGVWKLNVKAVGAGDIRFKAVVDADAFERPVQETEATTLY
jgi:uncharacterized repeat protein (TIGR01451 family)